MGMCGKMKDFQDGLCNSLSSSTIEIYIHVRDKYVRQKVRYIVL